MCRVHKFHKGLVAGRIHQIIIIQTSCTPFSPAEAGRWNVGGCSGFSQNSRELVSTAFAPDFVQKILSEVLFGHIIASDFGTDQSVHIMGQTDFGEEDEEDATDYAEGVAGITLLMGQLRCDLWSGSFGLCFRRRHFREVAPITSRRTRRADKETFLRHHVQHETEKRTRTQNMFTFGSALKFISARFPHIYGNSRKSLIHLS